MTSALRIATIALAAAIALAADRAGAAPSVWERARNPDQDLQRSFVAQAEQLELEYNRLTEPRPGRLLTQQDVEAIGDKYLRSAIVLLEAAGVATSPDPFLRMRLAAAYAILGDHARSVPLLEAIARDDPPAPLRARLYYQLAIAYAHSGRPVDEIRAYTTALEVEPIMDHRSLLLANRAEAYMLLGDVSAAVAGYREALGLLSSAELIFGSGSTTLWGLAVALDRSGDLESAFESIRVARSYDKMDLHLGSPSWFYVPEYDRHWYEALGHWLAARRTDVGAVRAEEYDRAVTSWSQYLAKAARDDTWLPIAHVRLRQCEKEREHARRSPIRLPAADPSTEAASQARPRPVRRP